MKHQKDDTALECLLLVDWRARVRKGVGQEYYLLELVAVKLSER